MNAPTGQDATGSGPEVILADRYHLVDQVASGGMATVWEGEDEVLGRRIALKILHGHLAENPDLVTRFRREAVAAARLHNPNIVSIYDTVNGPPVEAIVMEYVDGPTLREVLDDKGRLGVADVVDIGSQVSRALGAAHEVGIVHRDIKPSNILVTKSGRVMVTDFGIAKAGEDTDLTEIGTLLGTAKYLSPEQVTGSEVDPRSDLYSLGVVLFESLTGRVPFQGDTDAAMALARLQGTAPRVRHYRPDVPRRLDDLVARLLAVDPDDRPASATDVATAFSGVTTKVNAEETLVVSPLPEPDPGFEVYENDDHGIGFFESEQGWLLPALVLVVVLAALVVTGFLVTGSGVGRSVLDAIEADEGSSVSSSTPLNATDELIEVPLTARAFDPLGDGREVDERAHEAVDGDVSTYWETEPYRTPVAVLKGGVGLRLQLGQSAEVGRIELDSRSDDWVVEVYVGDRFGSDPASWGSAVTEIRGGSEPVQLDLPSSTGSVVLLWITDTGTPPDGGTDRLRFELSEVRLLTTTTP